MLKVSVVLENDHESRFGRDSLDTKTLASTLSKGNHKIVQLEALLCGPDPSLGVVFQRVNEH